MNNEPDTENDDVADLVIDITADEWGVAQSLLQFASSDEREVMGMVRLASDGTTRTWAATDSRRLARDVGGVDHRSYMVLVSPRIIAFASAAADDDQDTLLTVEHGRDGQPLWVTVSGPNGGLRVAADGRQFPPVDEIIASHDDEPVSLTVDGEALASLIRWAAIRALPDEVSESNPLFWLQIEGSTLDVSMDWPGLGPTHYSLSGDRLDATGDTRSTGVPPAQLASALAGWRGPLSLSLPSASQVPIRISDGVRTVLIMPLDTRLEMSRSSVESVLTDVFGDDVLHRDADGDYSLTVQGTPVYARLSDGRPVQLQVFAIVLDQVEPSSELLAELNDHNSHLSFARTFWVEGQVLAESDLVAETLDPEELITAFERVRTLANEIGPILAAVHGGNLLADDPEDRWARYIDTIITAETSSGAWVTLTGPDAVDVWPYEGIVHVITASNPFGRSRPAQVNDLDNAELTRQLWLSGSGVSRSLGADPSSGYAEAGVLVRGLSRGDATEVGRRFNQEAIFELDSHEVRVLGCFEERTDARPRKREQPQPDSGSQDG